MVEAAVPAPNYRNIDSRQLRTFMKVPGFAQSLTSGQRAGIDKRIMTDRWTQPERIVYDAVAGGYTSLDSLPVATGLTTAQIRQALAGLTKKGYVKNVEVEKGQASK